MLCTDLTLVNVQPDQIMVMPLRCRCWSCDHCQPMRKAQLVAQALNGQPNTFITLTSNPKVGKSPEDRARLLVTAWRKIRRDARKKYGYKSLPFMAVFEATKKGEPHLHILAYVKWLDQAWLSSRMKKYADAPIVDVRRIEHQGRMAMYVSKYVGKEPHHFKGTKRYWTSLDWVVPELDRHDEQPRYSLWHIHERTVDVMVDRCKMTGWTIVQKERDLCILTKPPP